MNGSPPLPGTSVKCVETIQPPFARTASATGFNRAGNSAIGCSGRAAARIGAVRMQEVVLQIDEDERDLVGLCEIDHGSHSVRE